MSDQKLSDENVELIHSFTAEGMEMIEDVEPSLIELQERTEESGHVDDETLNSIFRLFHTMKGSAGFLDLNTLQGVTHEAETLLDLYRKGILSPDREHIDLLIKACDFIKVLLEHIEASLNDDGFETEAAELAEELSKACSTETIEKNQLPKEEVNEDLSGAPESDGTQDKFEDADDTIPENTGSNDPEEEQLITNEMVEQFVKESLDLIDNLEQDLLSLESDPDNEEKLDVSFRHLHTFKGNCGFLGYSDMEKLSHKTETLLDCMRGGQKNNIKKNIGMILSIVDVLRDGTEKIPDGGQGDIPGCDVMIELLDDVLSEYDVNSIIHPISDRKKEDAEDGQSESDSPGKRTEADIKNDQVKSGDASGEIENKKSSPAPAGNAAKSKAAAPEHKMIRKDIRVDLDKVDKLVDLVGELSLAEMMVVQNPDIQDSRHTNFDRAVHHLDLIVSELQYVTMSLRMVPVAGTFRKMIRLVHDLSYKSGKKVRLKTTGEETEVDKTVIEQIADPLVHIVRNSIDHGLENPDEREKSGKPETGVVFLEAKHEGGEVWISIHDDGKGLDREKILSKAKEQGLVNGEGDDLSDEEIFKFIFEPGFSTAEKVTEVSGRGVGMDVVRKNIDKVKGNVDVHSTAGKGTTITLRIPLTLALIEGMAVQVDSDQYILPILSIKESFKPKPEDITITMDGQEVVNIRNQLLPVIRFENINYNNTKGKKLEDGILMIIEHQGKSYCIAVDKILGQQQTVIKGLSDYVGKVSGVSGCTILGDGKVSLILDVGELIKAASN